MPARLSVLGLYTYDPTIFDDMVKPSSIDRDLLVDNILMETAELECIYADASFMKGAIARWSLKESPIWGKLVETENYDYVPTENYNRTDTITDNTGRNKTGSNDTTRNLKGTDNWERTLSGNDVTTVSATTESIKDHGVVAFNEAGPNLADRDEVDEVSSSNNRLTLNESTVNTGSTSDTGTIGVKINETENTDYRRTANSKGNIGVTSTQELIQQQRDLVQFTTINYIIDSFKSRFCLGVW